MIHDHQHDHQLHVIYHHIGKRIMTFKFFDLLLVVFLLCIHHDHHDRHHDQLHDQLCDHDGNVTFKFFVLLLVGFLLCCAAREEGGNDHHHDQQHDQLHDQHNDLQVL